MVAGCCIGLMTTEPHAISDPALALWLLDTAATTGSTVLAILRSTSQLERVAALATIAAGGTEVVSYEGPDTLPYEPVAPSPGSVGRRAQALLALAVPPGGPRLVLTTAAAMLARLPPTPLPPVMLTVGQTIDVAAIATDLAALGYHANEMVDEPGEVAWRGGTADLYPAAAPAPIRLDLQEADGVTTLTSLHAFDPVTQRTTHALTEATLHQAIAQVLDEAEVAAAAALIAQAGLAGDDAPAPAPFDADRHPDAFTLAPGAAVYADAEVEARWHDLHEALTDAHGTALAAHHADPAIPYPPKPARLAITPAQATAALARRPVLVPPADTVELPAPRTLAALIAAIGEAGPDATVILATPSSAEALAGSLVRRGHPARAAAGWAEAQGPGVHTLHLALHTGVRRGALTLLPAEALLRHRGHATLHPDDALRPGEIVVHLDHGAARLSGLRQVEEEERVALEFADGAELLVPTAELDRVWRYGAGGRSLDRIGGDGWRHKRAELDAELAETARALADAAEARAALVAPAIAPPAPAMANFARRFLFPPSPDQRDAIDAVLTDLSASRPMDRLVCGDVGFGKTEIALRAAAAAAFAGHQVLVAAPTTVLANQHLALFRRRFAGTGIRVEGAIGTARDRAISRAFTKGDVHILVGTQGLANEDGPRVALAVIDEEQRFGDDVKRRLAPPGRHVLVMTATPIPRTLQSALVGLRDASIIATPPARRQPTRSLVLPWDPVVVRDALLRERRRGGQSFVVCPRIADLTDVAGRLASLVPELAITQAHGRMPAAVLDAAIVAFAGGQGDVLLATNIIEAGLDIPRANLMIVTSPDRFGLAQLHQLRGRVGRGARRGTAFFLTEPGRRLAPGTSKRLHTLASLSALGAGVDVAAADLDTRGAGALFGGQQAGHVTAVGTALYQHLLAEIVGAQAGRPAPPPPPQLAIGLTGFIPRDYVPAEPLRLQLYRRLGTVQNAAQLHEFEEELIDRFGPLPVAVTTLLLAHRVRMAGQARGLTLIEAGPAAVAFTPAIDVAGGVEKAGRTLVKHTERDPVVRATQLLDILG